jgi:hypothetical protein
VESDSTIEQNGVIVTLIKLMSVPLNIANISMAEDI